MLIPKTTIKHYDDGDGVEVDFYEDGVKIGTACTCMYNRKPNSFLHSFEVNPKLRGKGYGTQILTYMIRKYDVDTLYISKTNRAINLYRRFGFRVADKFNKDMIIMKRK